MGLSKLDKAKKLYMSYNSVSECARQTNLPRSTVSSAVKKKDGWEYERNLQRAELLSKVKSARPEDMARMTSGTITILTRAIDTLATRTDPPTVGEAKSAASILEMLDKIARLDEGSPTDIITEEKVITVRELQQKINVDPFAVEVDYEEID